jgi:probable rRNA maturation factor
VSINLTDRRFSVNSKAINSLVKHILSNENRTGWSLDIIYCRDRDIMPLNLRFKSKKRSTDVLAFDLREPGRNTGEIYVNLEMARRQAAENHVSYNEEVKRLTIHGVLHLLGYRDDTPGTRTKMWGRQESYL